MTGVTGGRTFVRARTFPAMADTKEHKPSFLRGVFAGAIHDALLFPYPPELDARDRDESRVVARLMRTLREMEGDGVIDSARFDADESIPDDVLKALGAAGFMGLTIPKLYGGLGLSITAYARVFGAVAAVDGSLGVVLGVHCGLGSKAIVLYGNEALKQRYLPALATGEMFAAYGLTESLEAWVRRVPEQYFWQHRRWKHQPDDTPPHQREP